MHTCICRCESPYACMQKPEASRCLPLLVTPCLISWDMVSHWTWSSPFCLGYWLSSSQDLLVSACQCWLLYGCCGFNWGSLLSKQELSSTKLSLQLLKNFSPSHFPYLRLIGLCIFQIYLASWRQLSHDSLNSDMIPYPVNVLNTLKWNIFLMTVVTSPNPEVHCPALTTPGQGTMSCRHHLGSFGPNTTCYFGCKTGFTIRGANWLRCKTSGQWTAVTPVCRGNYRSRNREFWCRLPCPYVVCICLFKFHPVLTTHASAHSSMKSTEVPSRRSMQQSLHLAKPLYT